MKSDRTVSLLETATLLGKNRSTVTSWIAKGCPTVAAAQREDGISWALDLGQVLAWHVREAEGRVREAQGRKIAALKAQLSRLTGESLELPIEEARRRKLAAEGALAEHALAVTQGKYIDARAAEIGWGRSCALIRDRVLNMANTLAVALAAATTPRETFQLVDDEARRVLTELADASDEADDDDGNAA